MSLAPRTSIQKIATTLSHWRHHSTSSSAHSPTPSTSSISSSPARIPPPPPLAPHPPAPSHPSRKKAQSRIAQVDQRLGPPVSPLLTDSFGRQHDYLRISLTEKCNLRCTYCMPEQGVPLLPKDDLLTTDEIERVANLFVKNGVTKIRLTGGEPTVRKDVVDVVARLGRLKLSSLGMTSNGIALKRKLPALVQAGLTHLNISLDTLDPLKYELMTRRRGFTAVMEALEVARSLKDQGLNTKLNVVIIRGLNDLEVPAFVELTRHMDITVRFIEYMPFEDNRWSTKKLVPSATLVSRLQSIHPNLEKMVDPHSDTTRSWRVPGYAGKVGFISSMSDHFCGECSRLRIGADGRVKVCLFGPPVLSLRPLLRSPSATDDGLLQQIGSAVWGKKFAHDGLGGTPPRSEAELSTRSTLIPLPGAELVQRRRTTRQLQPRRASPRFTVPTHFLAPHTSSHSTRLFSTSRTVSDPDDNSTPLSSLTHINPATGKASMVSVSSKENTLRSATAVGTIFLNQAAYGLIDFSSSDNSDATPTMRTKKGDVLTIAQLAGLMSAKHTATLIPLCHPLLLSHISVNLYPDAKQCAIRVEATVECEGKTGVEMEALTAAMTACLTVWDMTKAVSGKESRIGEVWVAKKSGGRSGDWVREE